MIHCNWTSSELLICRGGTVWRERNFGAHCLKALKSEVHRAEENEDSGRHKSQVMEPVLSMDRKVAASSSVTKNELPPWLQRGRRSRANKEQPVVVDALTAQHSETVETLAETLAPTAHESIALIEAAPSKVSEVMGNLSATFDCCKSSDDEQLPSMCAGVPVCWEDAADSDAST